MKFFKGPELFGFAFRRLASAHVHVRDSGARAPLGRVWHRGGPEGTGGVELPLVAAAAHPKPDGGRRPVGPPGSASPNRSQSSSQGWL